MLYGFITSPVLQLDETSPGAGREGLKLVRKYCASCRSLVIFAVFIVVLSSFLLFMRALSVTQTLMFFMNLLKIEYKIHTHIHTMFLMN
jgi:hypothetical protein